MRGVVVHAPATFAWKRSTTRRSPPRPMRSSGCRPPVSAAPTCGPTAASSPSTVPCRWGTSTSESSRRSAARSKTVKPGQFVVGSFVASDGTCEICRSGYPSSCVHRVFMAQVGTQSERALIPHGRHTRGHSGDARPGLATDIVSERGDDGVAKIKELTAGLGAHSVVEAVGTQESMQQAIRCTRPGGHVGFVGVNHDVALSGEELFFSQIHLLGGPAPVRRFLPELIDLIWQRKINPGKVFDLTLPCRTPPRHTGRWTSAARSATVGESGRG